MQVLRGEREALALVTGASSGIGAAFARRLARAGYALVLVARRRERLEALAAEIEALGARAEVLAADLAAPPDLARVEARIFGEERLELLINNAGGLLRGPFPDADAEEELVRVHLVAPLRLTAAALQGMRRRKRGAVIQVASRAAFAPNAGAPLYAAVKAALHRHALGLAPALEGSGVRMLSLCPGNTRTELFANAGFSPAEIAGLAMLAPEEVVEAALTALARGEHVCVPGEGRLQRFLRRCAPRDLVVRAAGVLQRLAST